MAESIAFTANDRPVVAQVWPGTPALDFIRHELGLTGTKEGCREGDCGACAVLLGERSGSGETRYRAVPSCLLATGELAGRHLVTIEGLASAAPGGLTPVMRAFLGENASQCGFCSPGFIVSLTGWLAETPVPDIDGAVVAVEGNLCRCTGYGSIRRAAERLVREFRDLPPPGRARLEALVDAQVLPGSVLAFASRGAEVMAVAEVGAEGPPVAKAGTLQDLRPLVIAGGTDWFVRNPEPEPVGDCALLGLSPELRRIRTEADGSGGRVLVVGAASTVRDFFASPETLAALPGIAAFEGEFASSLVRARATLGGNVANASPVADMTSMLIALGARVRLATPGNGGEERVPASAAPERSMPLESLFLGYKRLATAPGEILHSFVIPVLGEGESFTFAKASKRRTLDIAAVNSALRIDVRDGVVRSARLSAAGVAPVPLLLARAGAFLAGRSPDAATIAEAARLAVDETNPIGDVRGSAEYRRILVDRLVRAHFVRLFPDSGLAGELFP